ncbi:serine carboxypeptidase-like 2 [Typha latifolia]|uniref:serine carboxypeptidase-like 2 n=1 Tax=Typha latifolia TaxID=4733 RepID=UPI003C2FFDF4
MAAVKEKTKLSMISLLLNLLLCSLRQRPVSALNTIATLPGFEGPLPFYLETGYVEIDEEKGVELFYYFIKSERSPEEDPLMVWITGGPGCSAFSGLVFEIGPLKFDVAGYTEGLPTLIYNPSSWTQASNIIFLDSPVGTGFSYAKVEDGYKTSDTKSGRQILKFITKWLVDHPEFRSNPLYIGGDSYSGITVPVATVEIANSIQARDELHLNLKGYLIGNPSTDFYGFDGNSRIPFMHGMGLISDELYESAKKTCGGDYVTPRNAPCSNDIQAIYQCVSGINVVHILEPICGYASPKPYEIHASKRNLIDDHIAQFPLLELGLPVECRDSGYRLSYLWADDDSVRKTLGIHQGTVPSWKRCSTLQYFTNDVQKSIIYHLNLTSRGYRALVYSGDHDMNVPFVGTQNWIRSLHLSIIDDWRSWWVNGQVAGFTRSYSNDLTFATVKGAGHTAPEYKPKECLAMVDRWLSGLPL